MSTKVNQLQLAQQNLQNILTQKQQLEAQLSELDSSLSELGAASQAYKIIGKIMISCSGEKLTSELKERKEVITLRVQSMQKQEDKIKEHIEKLQKEVLEEYKQKK